MTDASAVSCVTVTAAATALLPRRIVIYCGACGMPPEYCEYGPDFETHCDPWLRKHHPELHAALASKRGGVKIVKKKQENDKKKSSNRPEQPWTTEQRLTAFYERYVPEKVETIPSLLAKYAGKEDKLFQALVKKYGPEPDDPYYADDPSNGDEDDDDADDDDNVGDDHAATAGDKDTSSSSKKKRRGAAAKKKGGAATVTRVVIQKIAQKKRRNVTVVCGMETVAGCKLKDVSKTFSRKFAGSSSVKDNPVTGQKEIIIQGDHMYDVAEMIVDKFNVPDTAVFLDVDGQGDLQPLR